MGMDGEGCPPGYYRSGWAGEWAVDYWVNRMIDRCVLVGGSASGDSTNSIS